MTSEFGTMTVWVVIVAAGVGTYALRLSFILLFGRFDEMPATLQGILRFVPGAVLAALLIPTLVALSLDPGPTLIYEPIKLLAAVVALGVAWRTEDILVTIVVGMGALWALQWLV